MLVRFGKKILECGRNFGKFEKPHSSNGKLNSGNKFSENFW